jgi:hypothetical protein
MGTSSSTLSKQGKYSNDRTRLSVLLFLQAHTKPFAIQTMTATTVAWSDVGRNKRKAPPTPAAFKAAGSL